MPWRGAYQIGTMLKNCLNGEYPWPQETRGVYVVSRRGWRKTPKHVLYVGGLTGTSDRFLTRIGDLIADVYGFYGSTTGHHSGGQSINKWCIDSNVHPSDLFLGWKTHVQCLRCAETQAYTEFSPLLNRKRPPCCMGH